MRVGGRKAKKKRREGEAHSEIAYFFESSFNSCDFSLSLKCSGWQKSAHIHRPVNHSSTVHLHRPQALIGDAFYSMHLHFYLQSDCIYYSDSRRELLWLSELLCLWLTPISLSLSLPLYPPLSLFLSVL